MKQQVEISKLLPPEIPHLTDGYTPDILESSWENALSLIEQHPSDLTILLKHGQEPYIFPLTRGVSTDTEALCSLAIQHFEHFKQPTLRNAISGIFNVWVNDASEKPSQERLEEVFCFYLNYIKKAFPSDLGVAKDLALNILPSATEVQPGYKNLKILQGFEPQLTVENIKAFQELAASQKNSDARKYLTSSAGVKYPHKSSSHFKLTETALIHQKTHLVDYLDEVKQINNGVDLSHPLTYASILVYQSILFRNEPNNPVFKNLPCHKSSPQNEAYLRDLGSLFNLNPNLPRPNFIPNNEAGRFENPYKIDKNLWTELENAVVNGNRHYKEIVEAYSVWQGPQIPQHFPKSKTWIGKFVCYTEGFKKMYPHIRKRTLTTPTAAMNFLGSIGQELPHVMYLEYVMNLPTYIEKIAPGTLDTIHADFWKKYFSSNPNCFTFEKVLPHYLIKRIVKDNLQKFLQNNTSVLDKLVNASNSEHPRLSAFAIKVLADYCENNPAIASKICKKILNGETTLAQDRLFAFVSHFENPQPIIETIMKSSFSPYTEKTRGTAQEIIDEIRETATGQSTTQAEIPEFVFKLDGIKFPKRDIEAMKDAVRQNRTSHISHEGNIIKIESLTTPLTGFYDEIRITKNRETRRDPTSLACNVNIIGNDKAGVNRAYTRLTPNGDLIIRLLDSNLELDRESFLRRYDRTGVAIQIDALFDELNYLALEALAVICVRKKSEPKIKALTPSSVGKTEENGSSPDSENPPKSGETGHPDSEPPNSEEPSTPVIIPGAPETIGREEGEMTIDLTEEEKAIREKSEKQDKIRLQSNLGKVRTIFAPLSRGEGLPEITEKEVENLLLHEMVELVFRDNGRSTKEKIYEASSNPLSIYNAIRAGTLSPENIYIRVGRAFSQPLPYVKSKRYITFHENESDTDSPLRTVQYFKVRKRKMRTTSAELKRETFMDSERGSQINIGRMLKFLNFDLPDSSDNRQIFEKISSGQMIPGILETISREIRQTLDEQRRIVSKKYLEDPDKSPDIIKYARVMNKLERLAKSKNLKAETILKETASKAMEITELVETTEGIKERTKLRFPYPGFRFDQTFNQGRFKSLSKILGISTRIAA